MNMNRPNISTFMPHQDGREAWMLDANGTIVEARDIRWIGVNNKHKSVYSAILEANQASLDDADLKRNASKESA